MDNINLDKIIKVDELDSNMILNVPEEIGEKIHKYIQSQQNIEGISAIDDSNIGQEIGKCDFHMEVKDVYKGNIEYIHILDLLKKGIFDIKRNLKYDEMSESIGISFDLYNDNNFSSFSLSKPEEFSLKKKWYEESLFKNQSRKETKPKKRFINDSVHSDFHYRFLDKAIQ